MSSSYAARQAPDAGRQMDAGSDRGALSALRGSGTVGDVLDAPGERMNAGEQAAASPLRWDFSKVRIHRDGASAESARAMGARAYTVGNHVVMGLGQTGNASLLRHELAHVVQQTAPWTGAGSSLEESEREADRAAESGGEFAVRGRRPVGIACAPGDPPADPPVAAPPAPGGPGRKDMTKEHKYTETTAPDGTKYKIAEGELGKPGTVENQRSDYQQGKLSGGTGDDAGHLIADLFGGAGGQENLSLQNWKANEYGTYKKLENSFAKKLKDGWKITVKVTDTTRPGENRPYSRKVEWTETSPDGQVSNHVLLYANTHTPESRAAQNVPPTNDGQTEGDLIHVDFKKKKRATTQEEIAEASKPLTKQKKPRAAKPAAAPKAVDAPQAVDAAKPVDAAKSAEVPKATEPPKAVDAPKAVETSKPVDAPKAEELPKVADTPKPVEAPKVEGPQTPHVTTTEGEIGAPKGISVEPDVPTPRGAGVAGEAATWVGIIMLIGQLLPDVAGKQQLDKMFNEAIASADAQAKLRALQPILDNATGDQYYMISYRLHYTIQTSPKPQTFGPSETLKSVEILNVTLSGSNVERSGELTPQERPGDAKPVMGGGWYWPAQQDGTASSKVESGGQRRDREAHEQRLKERSQLNEKLRKEQAKQPVPKAKVEAAPATPQNGPSLLPAPQQEAPQFLPGAPGESPIQKAERTVQQAQAWTQRLLAKGNLLEQRVQGDHPPTQQQREAFISEESTWRTAMKLLVIQFKEDSRGEAVTKIGEIVDRDGGRLKELRIHLGGPDGD